MRLSKRRRGHGVMFDLTPMIDVVFQLIIFFMTVSQATTADLEAVDLPQLAGAGEAAERDLVVNVTADGKLIIGGAAATPADVEARAKELAARKGGGERLVVALRVDRATTAGAVNPVVAALKRAGVPRGRIAVEPAAGGQPAGGD